PVPDETRAVTGLRDAGYAVAAGAPHRLVSPPGIRVSVSGMDVADADRVADAVAAARLAPYPLA
ncbi:MAG: aminotransferase class I/II-fold pyridoxal phosphate-dependent enzyme, partial [Stackebrandtia sp.]